MLRRGVIYTAMTRARRLLVIVGQAAALAARAPGDRAATSRGSLLARRLSATRAASGTDASSPRTSSGRLRGGRLGVRVFFASDLHVDVAGNAAVRRASSPTIAAADRPDVVIIAGDVCNGTAELATDAPPLRGRGAAPRLRPGQSRALGADGRASPPPASATTRSFRASRARPASIRSSPNRSSSATSASPARWAGTTTRSPTPRTAISAPSSPRRRATASSGWTDGTSAGPGRTGAPLADAEVADLMLDDLRDQLDALADAPLRTIVLVTHHLAVPEPRSAGVRGRTPEVLPRVPRV